NSPRQRPISTSTRGTSPRTTPPAPNDDGAGEGRATSLAPVEQCRDPAREDIYTCLSSMRGHQPSTGTSTTTPRGAPNASANIHHATSSVLPPAGSTDPACYARW